MDQSVTLPTSLACDLQAIPSSERDAHEARARRLFNESVLERRELPDGYAFRFAADIYPALVAFVANERLCCPFFRFALELSPAQGPIWLHITGPDGAKTLLGSGLDHALATGVGAPWDGFAVSGIPTNT
jgi:hypothetical protein